ncbi:hypothetical protein HYT18_04070 [Candidatus Microgenomates bacterium]|nr:hypothetical protein [Candidatus Microgenomates bacterium]
MKDVFDPNLLSELVDQSHNPPGGDPVLGAFYASLVEMVVSGEPIADILMRVKKRRSDITYKHLVNLIYRAFQAIKFRDQDLSYRSLLDIGGWHKELKSLCSNIETKKYFEKLLRTKSTTTTIYQRYTGPYAIVAHFWDSTPVFIADLGCGGNYGLRGIEVGIPFHSVEDQTPGKSVSSLLSKRINLQQCLAVDKENPDHPKVREWRMACSFYPQELNLMDAAFEFESRIRKSTKVKFRKIDLLSSARLPRASFNAVILSMILYQLNLLQQQILIERAKRLLKQGGIIIVQDYAAKNLADPRHLDFNESWFGKNFSFRTFILGKRTGWIFWEVFHWNNGRCQIVRPGEDFARIFKKHQVSSAKAAFAHSTS